MVARLLCYNSGDLQLSPATGSLPDQSAPIPPSAQMAFLPQSGSTKAVHSSEGFIQNLR